MIHNKCCGDPLLNSETFYKTIKKKALKIFPKQEQKNSPSAAARCQRDDLYIQRDLIIEHLKPIFH